MNKKFIKKLDLLFSKKVKERAGWRCEWCGKRTDKLNVHHIFSRRNRSVRWDLENGICLCVGCHFKAHQEPFEFFKFLEERRDVNLEELRARAKQIVKLKNDDYERLITDLKEGE